VTSRTSTRQTVLFICTGNSARSQMAEALLRHLAADRFDAHSAGLDPSEVHPLTHEVLGELGIDTSGLRSKSIKEYLGRVRVHQAIVVCESARQRCPSIYPFALKVHSWPFEDPAAFEGDPDERRAGFRAVRDAIRARIEDWLATPDGTELRG
jgi:arsenate reductase (thioredoxin)